VLPISKTARVCEFAGCLGNVRFELLAKELEALVPYAMSSFTCSSSTNPFLK
jgi:hypothetical protein